MEKKRQTRKPTNAQLERRLEKAVLHIDRTRDTKEVYFSDRGVRIIVTPDEAIIATLFHNHVFHRMTSNGVSKPYEYTNSVIDIALSLGDAIEVKGVGLSFNKMVDLLENDVEKTTERLIVWLWDKWVMNIMMPLYDIDSNSGSSFITFLKFLCNIAHQDIILGENTQGMTTKGYIKTFMEKIEEFTKDLEDNEIWPAMSEDEKVEKEMEAIFEHETQETIRQNTTQGGQDNE